MGQCHSAHTQQDGARATAGTAGAAASQSPLLEAGAVVTPRGALGKGAIELLLQAQAFERALAPQPDALTAGACPLSALTKSTELLAARLGADTAAIWAFTDDDEPSQPACAVLAAAVGAGEAPLSAAAVRIINKRAGGAAGSGVEPAAACEGDALLALPPHARPPRAARSVPAAFGAPVAIKVADALAGSQASDSNSPTTRPAAPLGLRAFASATGLRSFSQILVGPPRAPAGALLLASRAPNAFDGAEWGVWLNAAAMAVAQHLSGSAVARAARLAARAACAPDSLAAVAALLHGAHEFATATLPAARAAARLALLVPPPPELASLGGCGDGDDNLDADEAILFELARARASTDPGAAAAAGAAPVSAGNATAYSRASFYEGQSMSHGLGATCHGLAVTRLGLADTLLGPAIAQRQARFVRDCAAYMQGCHTMARDIFTRGSGCVSSIVVVPLVAYLSGGDVGGRGASLSLGGLYFALDQPCRFEKLCEPLLGFSAWVARALHARISGGELRALAAHAALLAPPRSRRASRDSGFAAGARSCSGALAIGAGAAAAGDGPGSTSGGGGGGGGGGAVSSGMPSSSIFSGTPRLNTEAMVQVLQHELRSNARLSAELSRSGNPAREVWLDLGAPLGCGGFGSVYRGWWASSPVAVKVIPSHGDAREAMRGAVEMAVLSSVRHPSVVQVFACLTDMVVAPPVHTAAGINGFDTRPQAQPSNGGHSYFESWHGSQPSAPLPTSDFGEANGGGMGVPPGAVRYRQLAPGEDADDSDASDNGGAAAAGGVCSMLVMELCDRGTLRDAVCAGAFHSRLASGAVGVDCVGVLAVLADVARALTYLHSMGLVHGDVKMDNVLLKTDPLHPRGFVPKLSDFGLAKILSMEASLPNVDGAGTISHLAPELLQPGAPITPAVDVYAFGIFSWELYCGCRAYEGVPSDRIRELLFRGGLARPAFPPGAPPALVAVAEACLARAPAHRPPFGEVAGRLGAAAAAYARGGVLY